jgi:CRP-like cAMP-binding protein
MRVPVRLRQIAIGSNIVFFTYGVLLHAYPVAVLHLMLLPLNIIRLVEIKRLAAEIKTARAADFSSELLRPFGSLRRYDTGSLLFHKDEQSTEAHVILSGRVEVPETGVTLNSGALVGEMAEFTPLQRRTLSARCVTDVETLVVRGDVAKRLYYDNREFGTYRLSLIAGRLVETSANVERTRSVNRCE